MVHRIPPAKLRTTLLLVIAGLLVVGAGIIYALATRSLPSQRGIGQCPSDAMMCADGSFVLREGPNCEFALCPAE